MLKVKLCSFAIACMVGIFGFSPVATLAAQTDPESVTLTEADKTQKDKRAAFEEKMKKASEKWNSLTAKQKDEVYAMIESNMKSESKLMDKLVELGVMDKKDAEILKTNMTEKFNEMKQSGDFPFSRKKHKDSNK
jgi:hypothetical protein